MSKDGNTLASCSNLLHSFFLCVQIILVFFLITYMHGSSPEGNDLITKLVETRHSIPYSMHILFV